MADFSWSPIIAAVISAGGVGLINLLATRSSAAKTEGAVTTAIEGLNSRMDRRETENNDRFTKIESDNAKQWEVLRQTQQEVGYLQGKSNGKSASAGGH